MTRRRPAYRREPRTMPRRDTIDWSTPALARLDAEQLRARARLVEQRHPQIARWLERASWMAAGENFELLGTVSLAMTGRDEQ